jgi:hypothetical protein
MRDSFLFMTSNRVQLFYSKDKYQENRNIIDDILSFLSREKIIVYSFLVDKYEGLDQYSLENSDIILIIGEIDNDGIGDRFLLDLTNSKLKIAKILIEIGTDHRSKGGPASYELAAKGYTVDTYMSVPIDFNFLREIVRLKAFSFYEN